MKIDDIVAKILKERNFFMGVAILLILFYHIPENCVPSIVKKVFYPGFIGVDLFLFFSAFGLSYSIGKRTIKEFYSRRFSRILPLFFILALSKSLLYVADGNTLTTFDWICNLTTLSYYGIGGFIFDWYLCVLLLLYVAFPLLYTMVKNQNGGGILLEIQWCLIISLFALIGFDWQFETAIARLPIVTLGIMCANDNPTKSYIHAVLTFSTCLLISACLVYMGYIHTYVLIYQLAPLVMLLLSYLCFNVYKMSSESTIYKLICYFGTITLELYVANNIALSLMNFAPTMIPGILSYAAFNILLTIMLVYVNKLITNRISKWQKNA